MISDAQGGASRMEPFRSRHREDALPPEKAAAQQQWLHTRGTDRLLRAIDQVQPAERSRPKRRSDR